MQTSSSSWRESSQRSVKKHLFQFLSTFWKTPVSWVPIIDCIHRRGVRKNIERKGHHALHQWEILETDLCVWTRAFLLERRWRQGSHLGHAWKVTDATEGLLTLCHGSWYSTWPEWRVCPCEEHRIWHRDHQTMHRTSSNHSQHSYWGHKRCSSWIGKHHWRNEPHEGFGPEKSMVRYPTRSIHPGAPDRCGWALGWSDRRFRTDVRRVQKFSSEWLPNEHMHWESHKMSELRKQLDKIGNLRNWSHWDGWIFTGCTSSCKVAQHLQRMCWLEKHGSRKGPSWILDHGNSCNALRIQNDQRRAQAGITSRCHPHAGIHGEGKMQTRPVAPIHCTHKIRWFYRLLWDGGNVAYHDYMKTVLTKEEIESMFNPTATAEYIGDIFEFWLGMLDLGIQFPTMFGGWGANLDSCLAGLEESFWLYSSSCRPTDTINTKRNRSRKAYIPSVENEMVTAVLREAGIFNLLLQKKITRMPVLPAANYDDHPEMVEISSSDEEMDEVDEPEEETTSPIRREALERSRLREKLMPEVMTSKLRRMKRTWGANHRRRRSAELRYGTSVINLRSWLPMRRMFSIASFVVECMTLMSAPHRMTRTWETHCGAWDWSWIKSQNPHLLQKDPKLRREAEKTSSRRISCHRGNDGEEPDSLRRRKWPSASTASQPSCTTLVIVKKEVNS